MKLKLITLAVAATLVTPAAFANIAPESVAGVQKIILSGAGPDGFVESAVRGMLEPGTIKTYRDNAHATLAFQHRAWYGLAIGTPGVTAGTPILFVHRVKGGAGVGAVARASRIETLDFRTLWGSGSGCTAGGAAAGDAGKVYDYFCPTRGLDPDSPDFANPALNNGVPSDFGVSDVSPALFKAPYNVEFGQTQLSSTELAKLTIRPTTVALMGIVVTNDVPLTTVISRADYGNMLMGNIQDWTQIDGSLGGNTQVVVCRQANGAGAQASYNSFFNNFPCESAFAGAVAPTSMYADNASGIVSGSGNHSDPFVIDPTQGYTVVNNSTSGDVRNCLKNAQNHTDHKIKADDGRWYLTKFSNSVDPFKAIGVLSGDSYGSENGWTYRNIDGAGSFAPATQTASIGATGFAPSKANLLSGAWDLAVELTMQYRNANVTNPQGDVITPLAGTKKAFADELIKRSGDPARISLNSKKNVYAALPDYYDPTASATNKAHVALGSRQGNMCSPLRRKY
ncbi:MAG: hypothetical protein Q8J70_03770 [Thiobacillus sp.]|nr:hypothetical protein [Thiobacillus sp.]